MAYIYYIFSDYNMFDDINIDNIVYTNVTPIEVKRLYNYIYLLTEVHPFKVEYLLNTTSIDTHSFIERFIYDIACEQMHKKINKIFNQEFNYITFSFLKTEKSCCEYINFNRVENGIITSIINLSDNLTMPFLFCKLPKHEIKNTQLIGECEISISKPGNILSFDPNQYVYDNVNMFNSVNNTDIELDINETPQYSLVIQILDKMPINAPLFNHDANNAVVSQMVNKSKYKLQTYNSENTERLIYTIVSKTEQVSINISLQKEEFANAFYNTFESKDKKALNCLSKILEHYVETYSLFRLKLDEPKDTVDEPKDTVDEPKDTVDEPKDTVDEPKDTVDEPKDTVDEPKDTVDEPKDTVDEPKDTVDEPKDTVDEPKDTVDEPKDTVDEPKDTVDEPKDTVDEPKDTVDEPKDKFIQRFTHKSILTPVMCDWIIHEAEQYAFKNGWTTTRHDEYPTTDIEIHNIKSVFSFILLFIKTIDELICKSYNVKIENIDIKDMFIAKYDEKKQNSLDMHLDGQGSNVSISILLNDEFEGGNLIYADDIISYAEKGDIMIHTSNHIHGVTPVTKGVRYSLVMFLRIKYKD
jgi:hypothetical protein